MGLFDQSGRSHQGRESGRQGTHHADAHCFRHQLCDRHARERSARRVVILLDVPNIGLIVHGGAWDIPPELKKICWDGVRRALDRGWAILESGGSALEACEQAIIELEDEPIFDAGVGSHLNRDGKVQLDAILMDGATLKSGAVVAVERIRNPIRLARLVLEKSEHMLLAGYGAEQSALER